MVVSVKRKSTKTDESETAIDRETVLFFIIHNVFILLRLLVLSAAFCFCFWATTAHFSEFGEFVNKTGLDRWLLIALLVILGGSSSGKVKTLLKGIGREHRRVKELEEAIDLGRDSSGLDEEGLSPEEY